MPDLTSGRRCGDDEPDAPDVGLTVGTGAARGGDPGRPAAVLWIPDIDARHKWREYYIYRDKPEGRPMGFR